MSLFQCLGFNSCIPQLEAIVGQAAERAARSSRDAADQRKKHEVHCSLWSAWGGWMARTAPTLRSVSSTLSASRVPHPRHTQGVSQIHLCASSGHGEREEPRACSFFKHGCSLAFASENKLLSGLTLAVAIINQNEETLSLGGNQPRQIRSQGEICGFRTSGSNTMTPI